MFEPATVLDRTGWLLMKGCMFALNIARYVPS